LGTESLLGTEWLLGMAGSSDYFRHHHHRRHFLRQFRPLHLLRQEPCLKPEQ
jgi:hypothetical protein